MVIIPSHYGLSSHYCLTFTLFPFYNFIPSSASKMGLIHLKGTSRLYLTTTQWRQSPIDPSSGGVQPAGPANPANILFQTAPTTSSVYKRKLKKKRYVKFIKYYFCMWSLCVGELVQAASPGPCQTDRSRTGWGCTHLWDIGLIKARTTKPSITRHAPELQRGHGHNTSSGWDILTAGQSTGLYH